MDRDQRIVVALTKNPYRPDPNKTGERIPARIVSSGRNLALYDADGEVAGFCGRRASKSRRKRGSPRREPTPVVGIISKVPFDLNLILAVRLPLSIVAVLEDRSGAVTDSEIG